MRLSNKAKAKRAIEAKKKKGFGITLKKIAREIQPNKLEIGTPLESPVQIKATWYKNRKFQDTTS